MLKCQFFLFADNAPAIFDIWFLGDIFLKEIFNTYKTLINQAQRKKDVAPPYIHEQFNVISYYKQFSTGVRRCAARIINALFEGLNERDRLPCYLVIIPDKDLISDIDVFEFGASRIITDVLQWMLKEINMFLHRKRLEILDKKPGAVAEDDLKLSQLSS